MFDKIAQLFGLKPSANNGFVRRRILIVDDNPSDLALVQKVVAKTGHEILLAKDGREGLEMARREKPDLIISDCRMPEMDGLEMARELKDDPSTANIPLIFLTSNETPKNIVESFDLGVDNYMRKPLNPRVLNAHINKIFNGRLPAA